MRGARKHGEAEAHAVKFSDEETNVKRLLTRFALTLLFFAQAQAAPTPGRANADDEQEITSLLRQFAAAQKDYDAGKLDQLLAPDYVEVSPVGEVDSRAKVIGFYAPEKKKERQGELLSYELDEISTRLYGDTAVVIARLPFTVKAPDGQSVSRALRCTFVCRKAQGKWRIVSTQYTGIRPPAPPKP